MGEHTSGFADDVAGMGCNDIRGELVDYPALRSKRARQYQME